MILLIDNYDSFVYNLARYVAELGGEPRVVRNDAVTVEDIRRLRPQAVIISPGPCTPRKAGISEALIREFSADLPMLGVCLGHQAIATALGGRVIRAPEPVHGRTALVTHTRQGIFRGLPDPLRVTRYHSLIIDEATLPTEIVVTARTRDGIPMAIAHASRPLVGVQFHPEAVLTEGGHALLRNFLAMAGISALRSPDGDYVPPAAEPDWTAAPPLERPPLRYGSHRLGGKKEGWGETEGMRG